MLFTAVNAAINDKFAENVAQHAKPKRIFMGMGEWKFFFQMVYSFFGGTSAKSGQKPKFTSLRAWG